MKALPKAESKLKFVKYSKENTSVFSRISMPQSEYKANFLHVKKGLHFNYHYNIKLSQIFEPELEREIVKQEFLLEYKSAYETALPAYENSFANANVFVLEQQYPQQLMQAKLHAFRKLFAEYEKNYLRFGMQENGNKEVATHAWLNRIVNINDEFVLKVVEKLETGQTIKGEPSTLVESLAKDFYGLYNFVPAKELAHVLAKQDADELLDAFFKNTDKQTASRILGYVESCMKHLDAEIGTESQTQGISFENPFALVSTRFNKIVDQINVDIYHNFYGVVVKETQENVFGKKFVATTYHETEKGISVPYVLDEYTQEFKLLFENNLAIAKLKNNLQVMQNIESKMGEPVFDVTGKQEEIKFFEMTTEFLYETIALKERHKAVRNALGDITSILYVENEEHLSRERMNFVFDTIENFVPNCTTDFLKQIENKVSQSMKDKTFVFETFATILEQEIVDNRYELNIDGKIDVDHYAERVAQAVLFQVKEEEQKDESYYASYLNNIGAIKRFINSKRLAEWAKMGNDFAIMNNTLNAKIEQMKKQDASLISMQEEKLMEYHAVLGKQVNKLSGQMDDLIAKYNKNPEILGEFVIDYVNSIRTELAEIVNPRVRNETIVAFAQPLVRNNVIENTEELKHSVEILLKREVAGYVKLEKDLSVYQPIITVESKEDLPLFETVKKVVKTPKKVVKEHNKATKTQDEPEKNTVTKNETVAKEKNKKQKSVLIQKETKEPITAQEKQLQKVSLEDETASVQSMDEQIANMKAVHMETIDTDAKQYAELEQLKQQLESFETLSRKDCVNLLQKVLGKNVVMDSNHLEEQVAFALQKLSDDTGALLERYADSSTEEKIAFVVLSTKQLEGEPVLIAGEQQQSGQVEAARKYNLEDEKEMVGCRNDLFWKMQLKAVRNNVSLVKTLENSDLTEFKQLAPIIKLFEISASDNVAMSDVTISGKQLNNQQLARVTILKLKDGKINDPVSVSHVNHMLANTSAYAKSPEYKEVLEQFFEEKSIKQALQQGTTSLETLIEKETKEGGKLFELMEYFYKKTSPTMPKLVKLDEEVVKNQENTNITI